MSRRTGGVIHARGFCRERCKRESASKGYRRGEKRRGASKTGEPSFGSSSVTIATVATTAHKPRQPRARECGGSPPPTLACRDSSAAAETGSRRRRSDTSSSSARSPATSCGGPPRGDARAKRRPTRTPHRDPTAARRSIAADAASRVRTEARVVTPSWTVANKTSHAPASSYRHGRSPIATQTNIPSRARRRHANAARPAHHASEVPPTEAGPHQQATRGRGGGAGGRPDLVAAAALVFAR